jgi:hypothetical protein
MPPAGFEPTTPESEGPHIHALDRAAAGISTRQYITKYREIIQEGVTYCVKMRNIIKKEV